MAVSVSDVDVTTNSRWVNKPVRIIPIEGGYYELLRRDFGDTGVPSLNDAICTEGLENHQSLIYQSAPFAEVRTNRDGSKRLHGGLDITSCSTAKRNTAFKAGVEFGGQIYKITTSRGEGCSFIPILASAAGTILISSIQRNRRGEIAGYGRHVVIGHGDLVEGKTAPSLDENIELSDALSRYRWCTLYAHMSDFGDIVPEGEIGLSLKNTSPNIQYEPSDLYDGYDLHVASGNFVPIFGPPDTVRSFGDEIFTHVKNRVGARVTHHSIIGYMGNSGAHSGSTGIHLHYEVRYNGRKSEPDFSLYRLYRTLYIDHDNHANSKIITDRDRDTNFKDNKLVSITSGISTRTDIVIPRFT